MLNKGKYLLIFTLMLMIASCGENKSSTASNETEMTVASSASSSALYFSGTVQPLKTIVITSPADGVVNDMEFHYGDTVKSSQLLFKISSEKFKSDYKAALMQYIKAKNDFNTAQSQLKESDFLHKNQLISDDDFKGKQSNYYNAQLSMVEAQDALGLMLKQLAVPGVKLDQLTIQNIDKISQALNINGGTQELQIVAPGTGVVLLATKANSSDEAKKLEKGDLVKQGDVLAEIGDVTGLTIHINVNEFNINQLKIGQKVIVTGAAFPGIELQGQITGLDRQGQAAAGGMPIFPVEIVVAKLTSDQQAVIHVGMSAKVQINIEQPEQIKIPITAVLQKEGVTLVKEKDSHGSVKEVAVKTGQTTINDVVIDEGLKVGDKILVPG